MEKVLDMPPHTSNKVFDFLAEHLIKGNKIKIGERLFVAEKCAIHFALCHACEMLGKEPGRDAQICGMCVYLDWKVRKETYRLRLKEVNNGETNDDSQ